MPDSARKHIPLKVNDIVSRMEEIDSIQKAVRAIATDAILPFNMDIFFRKRMVRFTRDWSGWPDVEVLSARIQSVVHRTLKQCPPCVITSVVRTWCNGWVTSHRFKEENDVGCIFGCKWAPDQLEHYAECGVCQQIWYKLAKIHAYNGPLVFFALGEEADSILTLRCVFMFAVHSVVIRQHALRCVLTTQQGTRAVTERWKYVLGVSSWARKSLRTCAMDFER